MTQQVGQSPLRTDHGILTEQSDHYAFGSDPFPGEGVVSGAFQRNVRFHRGFETCSRDQWQTGEEYCLYLERLSAAYFIKNEETFLTGFDLP